MQHVDSTLKALVLLRLCSACHEAEDVPKDPDDGCPYIAALAMEPSEAPVGSEISLSSVVNGGGESFRYAWTATGGRLAHTASARPVFTCTVEGDVEVTLELHTGACRDEFSTSLECTPRPSDMLLAEQPTPERHAALPPAR